MPARSRPLAPRDGRRSDRDRRDVLGAPSATRPDSQYSPRSVTALHRRRLRRRRRRAGRWAMPTQYHGRWCSSATRAGAWTDAAPPRRRPARRSVACTGSSATCWAVGSTGRPAAPRAPGRGGLIPRRAVGRAAAPVLTPGHPWTSLSAPAAAPGAGSSSASPARPRAAPAPRSGPFSSETERSGLTDRGADDARRRRGRGIGGGGVECVAGGDATATLGDDDLPGDAREPAPRRSAQPRDHRPRRPRQDHPGRRDAQAVACLRSPRAGRRADPRLQRAGAREGHHHPRQGDVDPLPRRQAQHHRHPRPRRLRRRGRAGAGDGRGMPAARRRGGRADAADARRPPPGAGARPAPDPRDQQDRPGQRAARRRRWRRLTTSCSSSRATPSSSIAR